jgi:hypothetical protein
LKVPLCRPSTTLATRSTELTLRYYTMSSTSTAVRVSSHLGLECFFGCPDCPVEDLKDVALVLDVSEGGERRLYTVPSARRLVSTLVLTPILVLYAL